jgi:alpha-glucosidase (family GH31 glycosyl hydrolase)
MSTYLDFTFDPVNYPPAQVNSFVQQLHSQGQQYVVILDPGIEINSGYSTYTDLVNSGAFIRDAGGKPFVGHVWPPENVIFPDFLHPQAQPWWQAQIMNFFSIVPIDGLWIDMNEISNFCTGECTSKKRSPANSPRSRRATAASNPANPPYAINNGGDRDPLNVKTLDMTAVHYNNTLEYDAHNLFGLTEAIATRQSLENLRPNERSFVLTRSTFPSSGHHVAHWTGDNNSDYNNLYWSIVGMLNFNIFGVPLVGSDICGFLGVCATNVA